MRRRLLVLLPFAFVVACSKAALREDEPALYRSPQSIPPEDRTVPAPRSLIWPVAQRTITRTFKPNARRPHDGIDISAPKGAPIRAPAKGVVVYAGRKFSGYGKMIIVEHPGKLSTIYGHLNKLLVKTGDRVQLGSLLGQVGRTGNASGYHLHFEVRKEYQPIDPLGLLP